MKGFKIAIIDSGIEEEVYRRNINKMQLFNLVDEEDFDTYGHGTMCYQLMTKYLPQKQEILWSIIKIFSRTGRSTSAHLIQALEMMTETDVNLINLSLSLVNAAEPKISGRLKYLCGLLRSQNKIIVCSARNSSKSQFSLPADFRTVIGVEGAWFNNPGRYWFNSGKRIQAVSDQTPILIKMQKEKLDFFTGNSKSAALFASIIAREMLKTDTGDFDEIAGRLAGSAECSRWNSKDINCIYNLYQQTAEPALNSKENSERHKEVQSKLVSLFKENNSGLELSKKEWDMADIGKALDVVSSLERELNIKFIDHINFKDFRNLDSLVQAICRAAL